VTVQPIAQLVKRPLTQLTVRPMAPLSAQRMARRMVRLVARSAAQWPAQLTVLLTGRRHNGRRCSEYGCCEGWRCCCGGSVAESQQPMVHSPPPYRLQRVLTQSAQSNIIATVMFMMTAILTMLPNSLWKAPQTAQQVAQWAVLSKVQ
jgi:hypothetical protein